LQIIAPEEATEKGSFEKTVGDTKQNTTTGNLLHMRRNKAITVQKNWMEDISGEKLRVNNQRHVTKFFLRRRHSLSDSIFITLFTKNSPLSLSRGR
jgi:hypothetical protein